MRFVHATAVAAILALGACGDGGGSGNAASDANNVSEDPFGATGAPGADMTDNGVTDGASGLADGNRAGAAAPAERTSRPVDDAMESNDTPAPGNDT